MTQGCYSCIKGNQVDDRKKIIESIGYEGRVDKSVEVEDWKSGIPE